VYHASSWASTQQLSELFRQGVATNDLRHIGLTVHCFDDTEVRVRARVRVRVRGRGRVRVSSPSTASTTRR